MMRNRRVRVKHRDSRAVISEILPYEIPASFSNLGLYKFLNSARMEFDSVNIKFFWVDDSIKPILQIIFGKHVPMEQLVTEKGIWFSIKRKQLHGSTAPFHFEIRHKETQSRQLSIAHPRSQIMMIEFYRRYRSLILYYTSRSPYSVRYPKRMTRHTVLRDDLFEKSTGEHLSIGTGIGSSEVESENFEYDRIRSYFVYQRYNNIHKFYESVEYRDNEKRFGHLLKLDITKCFDSIYTHAINWAIHDKEYSKKEMNPLKGSFAGEFDKLIQNMNDGETHGILIGPEVSRIFAEIILQTVDVEVEKTLQSKDLLHRQDYEIMRYVDDYFIFIRDTSMIDTIVDTITEHLRPFRFHLNIDKTQVNTTPFISDMSIAKEKIVQLLSREMVVKEHITTNDGQIQELSFEPCLHHVISEYKTILRQTNLGPLELVNFTLANLEISLENIIKRFLRYNSEHAQINDSKTEISTQYRDSEIHLSAALMECTELAFYIYGGSPRVAPAIKLARIATLSRKCADSIDISRDNRDSLDDLIYQESIVQLNRNPLKQNSSIEALYLLNILEQLDRHYNLEVSDFCRYTGIEIIKGAFIIPDWYNVLIVSNIIRYIQDNLKYKGIKDAVEIWVVTRIESLSIPQRLMSEQVLYSLTLISCPYVSQKCKKKILALHGIETNREKMYAMNFQQRWFQNWSDLDLYSELLEKRVQEVY